jgi:hypothetical protein
MITIIRPLITCFSRPYVVLQVRQRVQELVLPETRVHQRVRQLLGLVVVLVLPRLLDRLLLRLELVLLQNLRLVVDAQLDQLPSQLDVPQVLHVLLVDEVVQILLVRVVVVQRTVVIFPLVFR